MKRNIKIGAQNVEMASNAFTPILFRQIFKKDFIREITSVRKLAGIGTKPLSTSDTCSPTMDGWKRNFDVASPRQHCH